MNIDGDRADGMRSCDIYRWKMCGHKWRYHLLILCLDIETATPSPPLFPLPRRISATLRRYNANYRLMSDDIFWSQRLSSRNSVLSAADKAGESFLHTLSKVEKQEQVVSSVTNRRRT